MPFFHLKINMNIIDRIKLFGNEIQEELVYIFNYKPIMKDILIVTHNNIFYLKQCIESIKKHTDNYKIYVWDNASDQETQDFLKKEDITNIKSSENLGFIIPNNRLIEKSQSEYIILLNDDTIVYPNWDKQLIGYLQSTDYSQVGYLGGILDNQFKGTKFNFGNKIDYVTGWCFAISRQTYQNFGLFDENNLEFAYCEDADFSLRLKENNKKIYALHSGLVHHFENKTVTHVEKTKNLINSFENNHKYMKQRWLDFFALQNKEIVVS